MVSLVCLWTETRLKMLSKHEDLTTGYKTKTKISQGISHFKTVILLHNFNEKDNYKQNVAHLFGRHNIGDYCPWRWSPAEVIWAHRAGSSTATHSRVTSHGPVHSSGPSMLRNSWVAWSRLAPCLVHPHKLSDYCNLRFCISCVIS